MKVSEYIRFTLALKKRILAVEAVALLNIEQDNVLLDNRAMDAFGERFRWASTKFVFP